MEEDLAVKSVGSTPVQCVITQYLCVVEPFRFLSLGCWQD